MLWQAGASITSNPEQSDLSTVSGYLTTVGALLTDVSLNDLSPSEIGAFFTNFGQALSSVVANARAGTQGFGASGNRHHAGSSRQLMAISSTAASVVNTAFEGILSWAGANDFSLVPFFTSRSDNFLGTLSAGAARVAPGNGTSVSQGCCSLTDTSDFSVILPAGLIDPNTYPAVDIHFFKLDSSELLGTDGVPSGHPLLTSVVTVRIVEADSNSTVPMMDNSAGALQLSLPCDLSACPSGQGLCSCQCYEFDFDSGVWSTDGVTTAASGSSVVCSSTSSSRGTYAAFATFSGMGCSVVLSLMCTALTSLYSFYSV